MKLISKIILGVATTTLVGCGGDSTGPKHLDSKKIEDYRPVHNSNKIDFYAKRDEADDRTNSDCFYMGNGKLPPWPSSNSQPVRQTVFIGSNVSGPGYNRLDFASVDGAGLTSDGLSNFLAEGDINGLESALAELGAASFTPFAYGEELSIGPRLGRTSNPHDMKINWYSELIFILRDGHERFNPNNPFRVAVGVPGGISPFFGPPQISKGGKVMKVKYLSLPQRDYLDWDYIKKRDCVYYFEFSLKQTHADARGRTFETIVHVDPDGENGGPGSGQPKGWP